MHQDLFEQVKDSKAFGVEVNEWERRTTVHAFSSAKARDEWVDRAKRRLEGKSPTSGFSTPSKRRKASKEEAKELLEKAQSEHMHGVRPVIHRRVA